MTRLLASLVLAYALVLSGLLGAVASGGHPGQTRLAAQLGLICTIHGMVDPRTGVADGADPTPGKLACVEHCTLASSAPLPGAAPVADAPILKAVAAVRMAWTWRDATKYATDGTTRPPPRGPPSYV